MIIGMTQQTNSLLSDGIAIVQSPQLPTINLLILFVLLSDNLGKNKKIVDVHEPSLVRYYNKNRGGVDRIDQNISYYRIAV